MKFVELLSVLLQNNLKKELVFIRKVFLVNETYIFEVGGEKINSTV